MTTPPAPPDAKTLLATHLTTRPSATTLESANILRASNLAPALQAARDELAKHQLEGRVEHFLEQRPERDELLRKGILKDDREGRVAPGLVQAREGLERNRLQDKLEKEIAARPDKESLKQQGIIVDEQE